MNLKLLFFFLFLVVLLIPAELKPAKHKKHHHGPGHKHGNKKINIEDIIKDIYFGILEGAAAGDGDDDDDDDQSSDWLFELQEPEGQCNPNPCRNNGVCEQKGKRGYKCDCPKPFKGRKCEKGPKYCRRGRCGRGECVLISTAPFYECKCKEPFQPPHCTRMSLCQPNPCQNGGECIIDGNSFECQCPQGYRGRFCHVGPNDCYVDDGEAYRGTVSETENGHECLYWNSHFILENGVDPFNSFEDSDGLGPHNFCRNPDGDGMPWCFFRKGRKLSWDYCDVTECPEPTGVSPTESAAVDVGPTATKPVEPIAPAKPDEPIAPAKPDEPIAPAKPDEPTAPVKPDEPTVPIKPVEPVEPAAPSKPTDPSATEKPSQATQPPSTTSAPPHQFTSCGMAQPKRAMTRIFGGLKVSPGALPWQVSVQARQKNSNQPFRHICGGVLISSCWVLTAGHCIEQGKDMQVVMGGLSLDIDESTEQAIQVEEAILHENYRETPAAVYNDIGLLRLEGDDGVCANETQFVRTACLPDGQLPDGMECKISGWGATETSPYGSNHLLDANVLLINQKKCSESEIYGRVLDNTMFCAGHLQGGIDSCQGDSGGPLTCEQNRTSVIYGLVSWGDQCGRKNKPGVYTRVTHFLDWIKSKTQAF